MSILADVLNLIKENVAAVTVLALIACLVANYFHHGLQRYPGPALAKFTNLWRLLDVRRRRSEITHLDLHKRYGDVVRLGPNVLSFADPRAVKAIYGLNKGYVKVRQCSPYQQLGM